MVGKDWKEISKVFYEQKDKEEAKLKYNYALANRKYNIGDIVKDHIGYFRIDKYINYDTSFGSNRTPYMVYSGVEVTVKGVEKKRQTRNYIYEINIREKIS